MASGRALPLSKLAAPINLPGGAEALTLWVEAAAAVITGGGGAPLILSHPAQAGRGTRWGN